ncbi:MAG: NAD-dependent epimerase/dehydratase family protein [Luteibacter sp.]|uniref:NAD-dependent epimerase/dehydratase family protein n=1 Tax=Luteibacter sp. TaxID=1886636 RepID=UPI002806658D|nr:NAD-dependent epimerase/dehydratase family protein [Luteibacter sp.]MDQ7996420.1 NAD-dependent epimerase/dehydratase family protein [Luteibacter sp.]MDQ8047952.1 NAD-dependent epimerase/dehydratase family protein [Luteibacter sp.]
MTPRTDLQPLRVLVTGHAGFTGRYVTAALTQAGYEVVALTEAPDQLSSSPVDLLDRAGVENAVALARPDAVIHLAAIAFVAHGDVDAIYRTNVVGTRHLLEALASLPERPRSVVLASSANVYGNNPVELLDESVEPAPANDYAVSKIAMEYMAKLWTNRLPIVLARPFNYTGVGQSENFLLPKIVDHFRRGERLIELGNIDVARDFQDVRFVADAYVRLLSANAAGRTVNLCSGVSVSLLEVIAMMQELAGYEIEVKVNPAFVRGNEVARLTGDNRLLRELIGPLGIIPLRSTLEWMLNDGRAPA